MRTFFSIALVIFLVIDALGNLPSYLALTNKFPKNKRTLYCIRELVFALCIMWLFHYLGEIILPILEVGPETTLIGGGIVLFLIAIRLIYHDAGNHEHQWTENPPFIVPIATPIIASPSVLAVIMIIAEKQSSSLLVLGAILFAWAISSLIFLFGRQIFAVFKEQGLIAAQRLMGLIVAILAIQTILHGLKDFLALLR